MKKILVIGSGGREHAVCEAFLRSKSNPKIFILPGNAGTAQCATNVEEIEISDSKKIAEFCKNNQIDFVFVGPEQPLVEGLVDFLQAQKIAVFGPSKNAAKLEGSKVFMKEIATKAKIPTAKFQSFSGKKSASEALNFVKKTGFPCVIKADGLAAGKGVLIANNLLEAQLAIEEVLGGKFGEAGDKIVVEEFLNGVEVSYFVICDGENFLPLGFAHDHKKVGEGETGLNTGGMGCFSPSIFSKSEIEAKIINKIIEPSLLAMKKEGAPFVGVLFAGLMINENEPKLLEFNVRFGDPETQVLLPRIESDFVDLIEAAIACRLDSFTLKIDDSKKVVAVVMCASGYPEKAIKDTEIKDLQKASQVPCVRILHGGTKLKDGKLVAVGGRVLNIVATADKYALARFNAYKAVDLIDWPQGFVRRDIAEKASD